MKNSTAVILNLRADDGHLLISGLQTPSSADARPKWSEVIGITDNEEQFDSAIYNPLLAILYSSPVSMNKNVFSFIEELC